jgi:hypothetical protein
MTGDYYRYLAEFVTDKAYEQKAADYYKQAQEISTKVLEPTHPIRLGLALNYSVCFYECGNRRRTCQRVCGECGLFLTCLLCVYFLSAGF